MKNVYVVGGDGFAKECYQHILFMHYHNPEIQFAGFLGHNGYKVDFDEMMSRNRMYADFERHKHEETCNLFNKEVK